MAAKRTKVLLDEDTQEMVRDVQEAERVAGRPTLRDARAVNWLVRLGYQSLSAQPQKRKTRGGGAA